MSNYLFTSDLHLTDKALDEYRWSIFKWLRTRVKAMDIDHVFILGDITDAKDKHSSRLVSRMIKELRKLKKLCPVTILCGNHDYTDPALPFFGFLKAFGIPFHTTEKTLEIDGKQFLMLPHTRSWRSSWNGLDMSQYDFILLHQTLSGAVASNGYEMEGAPKVVFEKANEDCQVIAGDIHVPQKIGRITYCGSPHPVAFGDTFKPRVLHWDGEDLRSLKRTTLRKEVVNINDPADAVELAEEYTEGDQIKIICKLSKTRFFEWADIKADLIKAFEDRGCDVRGVELREHSTEKKKTRAQDAEPEKEAGTFDHFLSYCEKEKLSKETQALGRTFLIQ